MTELNDQTLLSYWYRNRNAEAFRVIASRHAQMVFATAMRILRNATEAEDVAQEIVNLVTSKKTETALPAISGVLATAANLFPWLWRLLFPLLSRKGRKVKRQLKAQMRQAEEEAGRG